MHRLYSSIKCKLSLWYLCHVIIYRSQTFSLLLDQTRLILTMFKTCLDQRYGQVGITVSHAAGSSCDWVQVLRLRGNPTVWGQTFATNSGMYGHTGFHSGQTSCLSIIVLIFAEDHCIYNFGSTADLNFSDPTHIIPTYSYVYLVTSYRFLVAVT